MQIAIIGAGFAGLALCYYLSLEKNSSVTIFDPFDSKKSASFSSSGLLHPFGGAHCKKTWLANECMHKANELISTVETNLKITVANRSGILRPVIKACQLDDFQKASTLHEDAIWWDQETCLKKIPYLISQGGLFIPSGISIDSEQYIDGLKICCKQNGAIFKTQTFSNSQEFHSFDAIVACTGSATTDLPGFHHLPLHFVKGQLIELSWPQELKPLTYSLVSDGYITMTSSKQSCIVGATYERNYTDACTTKAAEMELRKKAEAFIPQLENAPLISQKAGIRAFSPNNIHPIIGRVDTSTKANLWVFTGLGSKGMLQHAYFGANLARAIIENNPEILPKEVRYRL
ncbi:MAG: FAD-binding oxidoreductase [Chlamydiales bacterium]|nr:FAD-binding oxidoreductase [Chlamydiales bacterium]